MTYSPPSTIAQLLFESTPRKTFPALVRELDEALSGRGGERRLSWDNDDIVFVDFDETRVALGYFDNPVPGMAACLTIAVGPLPALTGTRPARSHDALCRRIVTCADDSLRADAVLWHQTDEAITCDLVDGLLAMLSPFAADAIAPADIAPIALALPPPRAAATIPASRTGARALDKATRRGAKAATTPFPTLRPSEDAELAHLRRAIQIDPDSGNPSNAQRMTAHAMNATLAILLPPVGAGLLAASYRYGTNLKYSARAMGATGALIGLAHSAAAAEFVSMLPL